MIIEAHLSGLNRYREAVNSVMKSLTIHGLDPQQIQRGDVSELRGGIACLNLKGNNVDAAVIHANINTSSYLTNNVKTVFRVDYAVRGNIREVLPGRILSKTDTMSKGVLNKQITNLKWFVPKKSDNQPRAGESIFEAVTPNNGELWENGPHQSLTELLNSDNDLTRSLLDFLRRTRQTQPFTVSSDLWNESIRINNYSWLPASELLTFYASKKYLEIVELVSLHVKTVRRNFGGLTF